MLKEIEPQYKAKMFELPQENHNPEIKSMDSDQFYTSILSLLNSQFLKLKDPKVNNYDIQESLTSSLKTLHMFDKSKKLLSTTFLNEWIVCSVKYLLVVGKYPLKFTYMVQKIILDIWLDILNRFHSWR